MQPEYSGKLLFPRLPRAAARSEYVANLERSLIELGARTEVDHPASAPAPVGGHPIAQEGLATIQAAIRALAAEFGFPAALQAREQAAFDRACGTLLFREMDIVAGDAASTEVWSFVSLVLAPEIPFWRFPGGSEERYFGGMRNTFQRLWWRAWTLGPDLTAVPEGAVPFGEDDFVQLMERPTVAGNRRLARTFHSVVLSADLGALGLTRSELVRRLVVQIRAQRAHVAFDVFDDMQLESYIVNIRETL
jgi:hypothetical protein